METITAPTYSDLSYTIYDAPLVTYLSPFVSSRASCRILYDMSYGSVNLTLSSLATVATFNTGTLKFTVFYDTSNYFGDKTYAMTVHVWF